MSKMDLDELVLEATEYPGWSSWCGDIIERLAAALAEALAQNAAHDAATRNTALEEAAGIADGIDDDALYPSLIGDAIRTAKG